MPLEVIKTSALPDLDPNALVSTDGVMVLDRSATTGPGSGPEGTLKMMPASRVASFETIKGVVHDLNLVGIDTSGTIFNWAAAAINAYGPYAGNPGEDMYFRSIQIAGSGYDGAITIMYFKLISGKLLAGGPSNTINEAELILSGGPWTRNAETNADLFLEIGDAGTGPIHTYFNLGKTQNPAGPPWEVAGQQFLSGILNGQPTIWHFLRGDGNYGGTSGNNTVAADFINLSLQPPAIGFELTKVHRLSLADVDTTQPELNYIAAAVLLHGPFTCLPGQQMVFKIQTTHVEPGGNSVMQRYYRLTRNLINVGGAGAAIPLPSWFMPDGQNYNQPLSIPGIILELGDIGTDNVWDVFNQGDGSSNAWDMSVYRFIRATQEGEIRFWAFEGIHQYYGGTVAPVPVIYMATEDDFFLLTGQPPIPTGQPPIPTASDNIAKTISVLNTDLATLTPAGLATYFNALADGIMKNGTESWIVNIVDASDNIIKTFELVNRGKGPVGLEAVSANVANTLTADMFFEINLPIVQNYDDITDLTTNQAEQKLGAVYYVTDASDDENITFPAGEDKLQATYRYKGIANGAIGDYELVAVPYGNTIDPEVVAGKLDKGGYEGTAQDIVNLSNGMIKTFAEAGKTNRLIGGVIRNTAGVWDFVDDVAHFGKSGLLSVTTQPDGVIRIIYTQTYNKVISLIAVTDDMYNSLGISAGCSVGTVNTDITLYQNHIISDYVRYSGSSWISFDGTFTMAYSSGKLTLRHSNILGFGVAVQARAESGYGVKADSLGATTTEVQFYNLDGTIYTGAANSNMKVYVTRSAFGKKLTHAQSAISSSNIWIFGIMEENV